MDGCDWFEESWGERRESGAGEEEGEGEVGEDSEEDEDWGRAEGLAWDPLEVEDGWVVDEPVSESREDGSHCGWSARAAVCGGGRTRLI